MRISTDIQRLYLYEHHRWMAVHLALLSYSYKKNKQDILQQNYLYLNLGTLQNIFSSAQSPHKKETLRLQTE